MRKERKILRFVPQKLRKSFANENPNQAVEQYGYTKAFKSKEAVD